MIPEGWREEKLGNLTNVRRGASPRPIDDEKWFSKDGPGWVRIVDVTRSTMYLENTEQKLSPLGVSKSLSIAPGDLIMSICATIGRPVISKIDACIHDGFVKFEDISSQLDSIFLLQFLRYKTSQFENAGQPGAQKNINTGIVKDTDILLPPLPEQQRIAEVLGSVDASIEATKAVIEQTKKLKSGLLQTLLTRGIGHTRFKASPLGQIPESWEVKTLQEIAYNGKGLQTGPFGSQLHAADYTQSGTPVIMPKDILNTKIVLDSIARIPDDIKKTLARHMVLEGDILFGRRGDIGRCCIIALHEEGYICGTGCLRVRVEKEKILPAYLIKYLQMEDAQEWLIENAVGQTMLNLNTSILGGLPIALPPLQEQRAIADIFEGIDAQITAENAKLTTLQTLKKGLMHDLLTGKVRV